MGVRESSARLMAARPGFGSVEENERERVGEMSEGAK